MEAMINLKSIPKISRSELLLFLFLSVSVVGCIAAKRFYRGDWLFISLFFNVIYLIYLARSSILKERYLKIICSFAVVMISINTIDEIFGGQLKNLVQNSLK